MTRRRAQVTGHRARRAAANWLAAIGCLLLSATAQADDASEDSVKAGFIYNFAKFTEWPAAALGNGTAPLQLCALGPRPLEGQFALLAGRQIQGRTIDIRTNIRGGNWKGCHALFLPANDKEPADRLLEALSAAPVLTIGDGPGFVQNGGMIGLKTAGNRVRFDINLAAARRAGLKLSSQMLKLAGEVLE